MNADEHDLMGANQTLFKGSLLQKNPLMCIISMMQFGKQYFHTNWNIYIKIKFTFVQNFAYIRMHFNKAFKSHSILRIHYQKQTNKMNTHWAKKIDPY